MSWSRIVAVTCCVILAFSLPGQEQRTVSAIRLPGDPPDIDGKLTEAAWEVGEWAGNFVQWEPYNLEEASEQTEFKILYNDHSIYVGIRALDSQPDKIVRRLGRRDNAEGDMVGVQLDSYNDDLTAFVFVVNAAGVKIDGRITNEWEYDETWNPVYYVDVDIDDEGWTAEFRIPYNQLRFADIEDHVWGLQVLRALFRKEELSCWQGVSIQGNRWVSAYGNLEGINSISPKKEVEIIPYVMGNIELQEEEEGNPFSERYAFGYNAGVDGKVAVTSDLTLNYTINPDFGQVEADPSVVNLTAYEIFFEERRPFFIEGNNIYNFPLSGGGGPTGRDNLFYSRRIGRPPHYEPELEDGQYLRMEEFSRILGALKLSGKTRNGWSVGIMEAFTNRETVDLWDGVEQTTLTAEPYTNYFNTRIQKDFDRGNTMIGGMVTATNRFIRDTTVNFLPTAAYAAGMDLTHFWKQKAYYLAAKLAFSLVDGSTEAITDLQESPRRYLQRPDATHLEVDSSLTFLSGNGGSVEGGKSGEGNWRYGGRVNWRSPGLELNDMGFLRSGDMVHQGAWVRYVEFTPFSIFRSFNVGFNQWSGWDYAPSNIWSGLSLGGEFQFTNYYRMGLSIRREFREISRAELFGGPSVMYPPFWGTEGWIASDNRKKLTAAVFGEYEWGNFRFRNSWEAGFILTYRPIPAIDISLQPIFEYVYEDARYVATAEPDDGDRYIMGALTRNEASLNIRLNFFLTPDLSIQYWGQPFLFSGDYDDFKQMAHPGHEDYFGQFDPFTEDQLLFDAPTNTYLVCEQGFGNPDAGCTADNPDYDFENPDFSYHEFRSNLVVRWEYIPGSFLYLVWSQNRVGDETYGNFDLDRHFNNLLNASSRNVFLIKFSYRFSF